MKMNSVSIRGFFQLPYFGSHPPIRRVSSRLTPYPSYRFASDERGWEEGKGREKRGAVTEGLSPSHHHRGHHLLSLCFVGFLTSLRMIAGLSLFTIAPVILSTNFSLSLPKARK
ncbi:hypothetical protein HanRHA438_Chr17g0831281 [Helianthus annuus]|uniref:Uncharacterized protein n=1 Tax=Helianthus annuus TaxID=4232 RepID=A0A251RT38_HELAN|nr:hypothetical protein HanXRQr2_Chr17g0821371 [Helianthus annuus]KAJ0448845.1 hypothetical protein HanHA89_Chr17g0721711 [Helianthus annuus]KAJ0633724.1 hypothetical protein HanLR1_Chr17g0680141 [Helianthus annuus]KAJ0814485.1 hypothetical protein HanPSC8_Chr17g0786251 [Helianthus annuus]KAJ0827912.1 hypothetical protein HanRHA438_Chr17g0831281 [Helianthus annuus]